MTKAKLHEIVESVKEEYLLNVIEESTSEIEVLKTKKFLNETASIVEKILLEGVGFDAVGAPINNNGGVAPTPTMLDNIKNYIRSQYNKAGKKLQNVMTQYGKLPAYAKYGIPALGVAGLGAGAAAAMSNAGNEDILSQLTPEQLQELLANIGG